MGASQSSRLKTAAEHLIDYSNIERKLHLAPVPSEFADTQCKPTDIYSFLENVNLPQRAVKPRHSTIIIFDLDDTLIPTQWIKEAFAVQKKPQYTAEDVYQVITSFGSHTCVWSTSVYCAQIRAFS